MRLALVRDSRTCEHDNITSLAASSVDRRSPIEIRKHHELIVDFGQRIIWVIGAIGDL